jgi:hypothetical protein
MYVRGFKGLRFDEPEFIKFIDDINKNYRDSLDHNDLIVVGKKIVMSKTDIIRSTHNDTTITTIFYHISHYVNRIIEEEEKRRISYNIEGEKPGSSRESLYQQQATTFSGSISANNFGESLGESSDKQQESLHQQQEAIWSNPTSPLPLPSYTAPRGSISMELAAAALRLEEKENKYSTPCTTKVAQHSGTGSRNSGLSQSQVSTFLIALKDLITTRPHLFTTCTEEALGRQTDGGLFVSPAPTLVFMEQSGVFSQAPTVDDVTDALLEANLILPSNDPNRKLPQQRIGNKRVRGWMFVQGWETRLPADDSKCNQSEDSDLSCHQSGDIGCSETSIAELTPEQQAKLW